MDDITYCASDCECINCIRNKANIRDHNVLHSWCIPEEMPDCPLGKSLFDMGEVMQKLKPCPFCGGTDVHVIDKTTFSFIECNDCLAAFHQLEACSVDDNVEAWNRRPETKEEAQ